MSIPCPLCGSPNFRDLYKLNGWPLVKCLACDFVYVNPRPPTDVFERGFCRTDAEQPTPNDHGVFNLTESFQAYYAHGHAQEAAKIRKTINTLLRQAGCSSENCRMLDFGCGDGAFLEQALSLHLDADGYDIGDWNLPFLETKRLLSRIFIGPLSDAPYPPASFDIVHLSAVMGHLYAPQREIKYLYTILKPGGLLAVMSTPNINSLFIRMGIDAFDGNVPLTHLSFFSHKTLPRLLRQKGFHPISVKTHGIPLRLTFPPVVQNLMRRFGRKSLEKKPRYYESDCELSTDGWQDAVLQSPVSRVLRTLHAYELVKNSCNVVLNAIHGGQVVDVLARKPNP